MCWPRSFAPSVLPRSNWRNSGSRRQSNGPRMLLSKPRPLLRSKLTLHRQPSRSSLSPMMKPNQTSIATHAPCRQAGHRKNQFPNSHSFRRQGLHWVDNLGCQRVRRRASSRSTGPSRHAAIHPHPIHRPRCSNPSGALPDPCHNLRQPSHACRPRGQNRMLSAGVNRMISATPGPVTKTRSVPCSGQAPCGRSPRPMTRTTATKCLRTLHRRDRPAGPALPTTIRLTAKLKEPMAMSAGAQADPGFCCCS